VITGDSVYNLRRDRDWIHAYDVLSPAAAGAVLIFTAIPGVPLRFTPGFILPAAQQATVGLALFQQQIGEKTSLL